MSHARQQIRDRIVTLLTGLPLTGANVASTRFYPVDEASMPALSIFTLAEEFKEFTSDRDQLRQLDVRIDIHAKAVTDVDDTLDTICVQVEEALVAADLGIGVRNAYFQSLAVEILDADKPTVRGALVWRVEYEVNATDLETIVAS